MSNESLINPDDLEEYIDTVIEEKLKFYKVYEAEVENNDDPDGLGRVQVSIHELGWSNQDKWIWAEPEFALRGSFIVPSIGDEVKIYFQGGNVNQAVYRGYFYFLDGNPIPESDKDKGIIIHTPISDIKINYDDSIGKIEIKVGSVPTIEIDASTGIKLNTGDAAAWTPCIIQNCIFSGAPHGGPVAGIIKLTGG